MDVVALLNGRELPEDDEGSETSLPGLRVGADGELIDEFLAQQEATLGVGPALRVPEVSVTVGEERRRREVERGRAKERPEDRVVEVAEAEAGEADEGDEAAAARRAAGEDARRSSWSDGGCAWREECP